MKIGQKEVLIIFALTLSTVGLITLIVIKTFLDAVIKNPLSFFHL